MPFDGWHLLLSWSSGLLIVCLFAYTHFNEDTGSIRETYKNRILSQIYIRDLVFTNQFNKSFLIYLFLIILLYTSVSVLGRGLGITGQEKISEAAWPFFSALIVVGLFPLPWVKTLELKFRTFLHNRAMITAAAENLAGDLKTLGQEIDLLPKNQLDEIFVLKDVQKKFSSRELKLDTIMWLKSNILIFHLENAARDAQIIENVGTAFINKYQLLLEQLSEDRNSIVDQTKLNESKSLSEYEDNISRAKIAVSRLHDDVFSFCGCILINRPKRVDLVTSMRALNFITTENMSKKIRTNMYVEDQFDVLVAAYFYAVIISILLYGLFNVFDATALKIPVEYSIGWPERSKLGDNLYAQFLDLAWIGLVTWCLFSVRASKIKKGQWYSVDPLLNRAGVVSAQELFKAGLITLSVAAFSSLVFGVFQINTLHEKCSPLLDGHPDCIKANLKYLNTFLPKEGLKLFAIISGLTLFCIGFEKTAKRSRIFFILTTVVFSFLYSAHLINREYSGIDDEVRTGYLIAYLSSLISFWLIFVGISWRGLETRIYRNLS